MTSIERTAYPRFKRYYTPNELKQIWTPTIEEKKWGLSHTSGENNYTNLIVLLKVFQRLGYLPLINDIPHQITEHIKKELSLVTEIQLGYETSRTLYRHRSLIRSYLQVTQYNSNARLLIKEIVTKKAYIMDNPADLINVAIEELIKERYELPSFRELDRQVNHLRSQVNQKIFDQTIKQLSPETIESLNALLDSHPQEKRTPFNQLKSLPKRPSRNHLNDLLVHLMWLVTDYVIAPYLQHIASAKIKHFASEARVLDAGSVKKMNIAKRLTVLLCLIYESQIDTRDNLVEMFLKRMGTIHKKAQDKLEQIKQQNQDTSDRLLSTFTEVLQVFSDEEKPPQPEELLQSVQATLTAAGGVEKLLNQCEEITAYKGNNYYPLMWKFYSSHRSVFFRLINAEVCVFSYLAAELKSGDISVVGSSSYADTRQQLLPWSDCQAILDTYCANIELPNEADSFVDFLKSWLQRTATKVDKSYPNNGQIIINENGEPILKKLPSRPDRPSLKNLEAIIAERMPNHNLIDVLRNVDYWTNFTRHFGPLSGSDPKLENPTERYLLTTFTYGCNLGATQAARHMRGIVTAKLLMNINRRHVNVERLNRAITDIISSFVNSYRTTFKCISSQKVRELQS